MILRYICDDARHLVCVPYSLEGLHVMAADLGIKRCWFHAGSRLPHYDIPKRRVDEIKARCKVMTTVELLAHARGFGCNVALYRSISFSRGGET